MYRGQGDDDEAEFRHLRQHATRKEPVGANSTSDTQTDGHQVLVLVPLLYSYCTPTVGHSYSCCTRTRAALVLVWHSYSCFYHTRTALLLVLSSTKVILDTCTCIRAINIRLYSCTSTPYAHHTCTCIYMYVYLAGGRFVGQVSRASLQGRLRR